MDDYPDNDADIKSQVAGGAATLTDGAQFWVYLSPQNSTEQAITTWAVTLRLGEWSGVITSQNPQEIVKTPGLSGVFEVTVVADGPNMVRKALLPLPDSNPQIGCNANCAAMIGLVANADGTEANYWTVWDALCNPY